ncbi:NAD(P)/FAD-dependent oxidoreductase [Agromyces ramosus]|uniref:NAD(P)/FAD-dependent oxidoreductase n=1 Tax=Agromyces ramosus TaxID=33879 RepID=UPI0040385BE8
MSEGATDAAARPFDADVAVIGAGPAGLSAALNLVRARRTTLLIDANRPRNAATLASHGFLTRDGVSPLELRRIGREEFERYSEARFHAASVDAVSPLQGGGFRLTGRGVRGAPALDATALAVVIAAGLVETLPALPSIRAWYGTQLHSCVECDAYEKSEQPLVLIGESDDLAERALLISQWSDDLLVCTNGVGIVTVAAEAALAARGIRVDRRPIADVEGADGRMTGVRFTDESFERRSGAVRAAGLECTDHDDRRARPRARRRRPRARRRTRSHEHSGRVRRGRRHPSGARAAHRRCGRGSRRRGHRQPRPAGPALIQRRGRLSLDARVSWAKMTCRPGASVPGHWGMV